MQDYCFSGIHTHGCYPVCSGLARKGNGKIHTNKRLGHPGLIATVWKMMAAVVSITASTRSDE
jgi:hypothetical protein